MSPNPRIVSGPALAVALAVIGIAVILFVTVFGPLITRSQRQDRLLREGVAAVATVRDIRPTGSSHNENPEVSLKLDVTAGPSDHFEATVLTFLSPVYMPRFQPGAVINVRYDPKDRNQVAVVLP